MLLIDWLFCCGYVFYNYYLCEQILMIWSFIDEEIDGKTLLRLTGPDLRALNIKMGSAYKIMEIIEDASSMVSFSSVQFNVFDEWCMCFSYQDSIVQPDGSVVPSVASVESGSNSEHSSQASTMGKECSESSPGPSGSNLSQVVVLLYISILVYSIFILVYQHHWQYTLQWTWIYSSNLSQRPQTFIMFDCGCKKRIKKLHSR